jgi:hypothetical protein
VTAAFQVNAFQPNAFQTLTITGVLSATDQNDLGSFTGVVQVAPIIVMDMHDGGPKKRKKEEEEHRRVEAAKAKARRDEVLALFEQIVEGKPRIAEEIAEPFVLIEATIQAPAVIDYEAMLADIARVEQIYSAYIEMDDEDVLLLL